MCKCKEPPCQKSQFSNTGYCYTHMVASLPPNIKLIEKLGNEGLLPDLEPVDVMVLRELKAAMLRAHGEFDLVLGFIAAWVKDFTTIKAMEEIFAKVPPSASATRLLRALQQCLRNSSGNAMQRLTIASLVAGALG